jgi:hypothetical protein
VGGALGLIGFWLVVGLLNTVCPNRQGEDVCFSRWFVFWNLQKHSGNLMGRALGIFGLWKPCCSKSAENTPETWWVVLLA